MYTPISIQDKKEFIQWFLKHYELKQWETNYLLTYLTTHENLLTNMHFVKDVSDCPRAIVIASTCSAEPSFRYYKEQEVTDEDRKSTRLNSSHVATSYAVFCLKKKTNYS